MLPEELPVVLTLFLTMGALRMSRARVLARRGSAIEALGAATVLCTDKTGTLTQNRMEIAELRLPDGRSHAIGKQAALVIPEPFVELAGLGILACLEQPFDPMETAFHELGGKHQGQDLTWRQSQGWTLHRQYPLSPELLAVSHVWGGGDEDHVIAAKGAPEAIADLCGMAGDDRARLQQTVDAMAQHGLRVLGVAEARWRGEAFPESQSHFDFALRGLVGLSDPIREAVPSAVTELRSAGVRVVMITGDYPATARAIAAQAGIEGGDVMTGAELDAFDDAALAVRIREVSVFARVMPEQKLRIVQALKSAGEIVAMTGDGVNDAPSLKAAHIGIAMGRRGTDVAREASAIVLLDDDFSAIPAAMRLGRRIYDNLRKAMGFIFAVHIPIGGLALAPLLADHPGAGSHRLAGNGDRSGLLARFRGGAGGTRRNAPPAPRPGRRAVSPAIAALVDRPGRGGNRGARRAGGMGAGRRAGRSPLNRLRCSGRLGSGARRHEPDFPANRRAVGYPPQRIARDPAGGDRDILCLAVRRARLCRSLPVRPDRRRRPCPGRHYGRCSGCHTEPGEARVPSRARPIGVPAT
jgi:soluble P-type ATPase